MRVLVTAASRHGATHSALVAALADWAAIDGFASEIAGHLERG
jgi:hypothetical protein